MRDVEDERAPVDPYDPDAGAARDQGRRWVFWVLMLAWLGTAVGWMMGKAVYRAEGVVRVSAGADADAVVERHRNLIASSAVAARASRDGAWFGSVRRPDDWRIDEQVRVERAGAGLLRVYVDAPDERLAEVSCNSVLRGYQAELRQRGEEAGVSIEAAKLPKTPWYDSRRKHAGIGAAALGLGTLLVSFMRKRRREAEGTGYARHPRD
jgi:hypothetical protein